MMEKGRTLAFQVGEELFQKVKEYLAWYEKTYHRRLTQKEFVIGLIEEALEEMKENLLVALAKGCCRNVSRSEVHDLIDEIYDEYEIDN